MAEDISLISRDPQIGVTIGDLAAQHVNHLVSNNLASQYATDHPEQAGKRTETPRAVSGATQFAVQRPEKISASPRAPSGTLTYL